MERLDQGYLRDLVKRAGTSGNAFAELYAATCQRQYAYILYMLKDPDQAAQALKEVYVYALHHMAAVPHEDLFLPWISRVSRRVCMDYLHDYHLGENSVFHKTQLLNLPLSESQVLLMKYGQGIGEDEIGDILNLSRRTIRKMIKAGKKHLGSSAEGKDAVRASRTPGELDHPKASQILSEIFDEAGQKPNTIPLEALNSYAVYRKERFSLQRGILAGAMVLFVLLPMLFILPRFDVEALEKGERGLPVYSIRMKSVLPVGKVTARLRSHSLPVYEAGRGHYTVEPTRNGELSLTVSLVNRQSRNEVCTVNDVDAKSPELVSSDIRTDSVLLTVMDEGIGVSWHGIYAADASGVIHYPISFDAEQGTVLFEYPSENWDVYIPDYIGNTLHLAMTFH